MCHSFVTPWTVVLPAPLSVGFPSKNTRVRCYIFFSRRSSDPGIKLKSIKLESIKLKSTRTRIYIGRWILYHWATWHNTKIYLVFAHSPWHRASKTLGISWVIGVSFVIPEFMLVIWLWAGLRDNLRMGLVTRETKWLECQPHPPTSRKGRVGMDIELYRKIMNSEIQKAPSLVNNSRCCKGDMPGKVWTLHSLALLYSPVP